MTQPTLRACSVALTVLTLSCSSRCRQSTSSNGSSSAERPAASAPVVDWARVAVTDLGRLTDLIGESILRLPWMDFDPAALVAAHGRDPRRLFAWVRDHTYWAPYQGLLRGPRGVMLDRLGSNLDRAVLLGDLVRRTGAPVRLVRARLSETDAEQLLAAVRPIPATRRAVAAPAGSAEDAKAAEFIPGYAVARVAAGEMADARWTQGLSLLNTHTQRLTASVEDFTAPKRPEPRAIALAAMADHWWVEYQNGDRWEALDVLRPAAPAGDATDPAAQRFDWPSSAELPPVPDDDSHSVRVRVIVEQSRSGALTEAIALTATIRPAEALEHPITLSHLPAAPLADAEGLDEETLRRIAPDTDTWIPVLSVGKRLTATAGFHTSGDILAEPLSGRPKSATGSPVGGLEGALGGGDDDPEGTVTAEWLEFEVHAPGRPVRIVRREVFDLLGPARREARGRDVDPATAEVRRARAHALTTPIDIFIQSCELNDAFLAHLESATLLANRAAIHELARQTDAAQRRRLARALYQRLEVWSPLLDFAQARSMLNASDSWLIDQINVFTYRATPVPGAERAIELIDIAVNEVGVPGQARDAFQTRMRQGIADTLAEMLVLGADPAEAANTASLYGNGDEAGRWTFIRAGDLVSASQLNWPGDVKVRLATQLKAGFHAVALTRAVTVQGRPRLAWWRIDPTSGNTVGVMDTGFHQIQVESSTIRSKVASLQAWLQRTQRVARQPMNGRNAQWLKKLQDDRAYVAHVVREIYRAGYMGL